MNVYPVWWDTTVTLYNKYEDPATHVITWNRVILDNCFWKSTHDKVTVGDTVLESSVTLCRIPKNENFLPRHEWIKVPNDQMQQYFTLGTGDILVKYAVEDVIDEYTKGARSSDIITKYKGLQGCIQIEEVALNIGPGRCEEHYLVRGN